MNLLDAVKKRKEWEAGLVAKAMENAEFKKALLDNPHAVIEKETGHKMPAEVKIKVFEEEAGVLTIPIPRLPKATTHGREVSDSSLDQVAGGVGVGAGVVSSTCVAVTVV